jgi:hypothetical protein
MQEHLRLHFNNEEASDEQVLQIYPSTIRRRILRHLYLADVKRCYLFRDTKQKFLDALLSAGKVELYMPKVGWLNRCGQAQAEWDWAHLHKLAGLQMEYAGLSTCLA